MGASSYPGMTQPFSMGHTSNMGSVGVRQDSMGNLKLFFSKIKLTFIVLVLVFIHRNLNSTWI